VTEKSIGWTTGGVGDGASLYTMDDTIDWLRRTFTGDNGVAQGVLIDHVGSLAVTVGSGVVNVAGGGAIIYGFPYWNTSSVAVSIPTPAGATRIDRIVLRASWAARTVRITRIAGTPGAGAPSIVQTAGTTWDIPLAQVSITTEGAITVTDQRAYCHYATRISTAMIDDGAITAAKLVGGSVATAMIADGAVTTPKIVDGSVGNTELAGGITGDRIATVPNHIHSVGSGDGGAISTTHFPSTTWYQV
jgi:hypothetical protein